MSHISKKIFYEDIRYALFQMYPNAYLATWNAAEEWGLVSETALDFRLFSPSFQQDEIKTVFGISLILKKIPSSFMYGTVVLKSQTGEFAVSDIHKTIIDSLLFPNLAGDSENITEMMESYFQNRLCDEKKLLQYAKKSGVPSIISTILQFKKDLM